MLGDSGSELYPNVMGQGREPVFLVMNRGKGNYSIPYHVATFERRGEIFNYNHFITQYIPSDLQIEEFDLSNSTKITYQDLLGNSHTNIGPVFGKKNTPTTNAPTSAPEIDNKNDNSL